ncbi:hypothetical protein AOL_s00004g314 [Orbilia oligospora ATCC 24927]|uniref:Uncharacterized protein n=1 Tax=Arthrobotrys oligospora (strain ATCC 24927 / CBS 115.81 / DSM 1491) TaxID=756982 RepID=G1WYF4_ARTOA|nr:hypothetical protein AOL_s00004g314 [Orbilia oligospora ATCC 24927]EGX54281.1 hypothetical protein AOL_s00004g314 [Orbilia oligospora ATCC 24927]
MASEEAIGFNAAEYEASSCIIPEQRLLALREKLIKLNIKNPSRDSATTYRELKGWVEPLLDTGSSPQIENGHRVCAVDALSIVFNRLGGLSKMLSVKPESSGLPETRKEAKYLPIFRDYFDLATAPVLKSLKDCLTAFVAFGTETWDPEERQIFSTSIAEEVFDGIKKGDLRKGDSYLVEFLIKKKWFASKTFFIKNEGEKPSRAVNLGSIFKAMDNRTLAPGIGRLLSSLLRRLQEELVGETDKESLKAVWLSFFKADLARALLSLDEHVALNTELYVVPGVFHDEKEGFALFIQHLIHALGPEALRNSQSSMAIIGCLRTGKENGWLTELQVDEYVKSLGGYDSLLSDQSGLLRSHTLRLMIISSSVALPFTSSYTSIFCDHFDDLFSESDPQVRNEIYAGFRVLLERLVASSYALNKKLRSLEGRPTDLGTSSEAIDEVQTMNNLLLQQKAFTSWFLNELLPAQLRPNASYQRVILALKVYSYWLPQIERDQRNSLPGSDLAADIKKSKKKQNEREHIVLPFDPEIQYSHLLRLLVERIMDPYDDIRSLATGLIKELPQSKDVQWAHVLQRSQRMIEDSGRPGQEDGFSRILEVLYDLSLKDSNISREVWEAYASSTSDGTIVDLAFMLLDKEPHIQCQSQANPRSRIDNSVLGALALIFKRKDANLLVLEEEKRQKMFDRVLKLAQDIWARERDILCNESPEGRGVAASGEDSDDEDEDQLNSQGFLSYSWRVVSEASSLLGAIATYVPKGSGQISEADNFLQNSGDLLIEQLTSIRHRGSLSSIFPALTAICHQCLASKSTLAQGLPRQWLDKLLGIVSSSGKLITRRSAGLPMAIGAIIISEIQMKKKQIFFIQHAFSSLGNTVQTPRDLSTEQKDENGHLELPQVHALNCMRFLFMDSQLSTVVDPYVSSSLHMAFNCFKSEIWAVRNCGIMLYTAIVNRIFPKDGSMQVFKAERFFQRYSGLDTVFLETLSDGFQDLSDHRLIEAVYPALDVISRLSFQENQESEAFKDLVIRYLECKIWKTREAAAKSILAFTPRENAVESYGEFLLWNFGDYKRDNNVIHGGLCTAREIYERRIFGFGDELQSKIEDITKSAAKHYFEPSNRVSPVNQAHFIQICSIVFSNNTASLTENIVPFCQRVLEDAQGSPPRGFADSLLRKEIARVMAVSAPNLACGYLSFHDPDYGVSLSEALAKTNSNVELHKTLRELKDGVDTVSSDEKQTSTAFNVLQEVLNHHDWEWYRVAAVNLLLLSSEKQAVEPTTLAQLASNGLVEPLKESALTLLGRNIFPMLNDDRYRSMIHGSIQTWVQELFNNVKDEIPHSSRMAVLRSIEEVYGVFKSCDQQIQQALLPIWIVLQKLLNDDEEDVRSRAACIVAKLLAIEESEQEVETFTPLRAERRLFEHLARIEAFRNIEIQQRLLEDVIDLPLEKISKIKERLITANTPNTLLFKIEKQNLYRDELRCMDYYLELLSKATAEDRAAELVDKLTQYVTTGMQTLWDIAQEYQVETGEGGVSLEEGKLKATDGIMGWTTATEEMFVSGMRVANGFKLLRMWDVKGREVGEIVGNFVEYGERDDVKVNSTWLEAFRSP